MTPGAHDPLGTELGRMAVDRGYVTAAQLANYQQLQAQLGGKHHLGALLVARGALTEQQLRELLSLQQSAPRPPAAPRPQATPYQQPQQGMSQQGMSQPVSAQPRPPVPSNPPPMRRNPVHSSRAYVVPSADAVRDKPGRRSASPASPYEPTGTQRAARPQGQAPEGAGTPQSLGGAGTYGSPGEAFITSTGLLRPVEDAQPGIPSEIHLGPAPAGSKLMWLLEMAERERASDVHLHAAAPPAFRIEGQLRTVSGLRLDAKEQERLILEMLEGEQRRRFLEENDLDLSIETPTGLRCRTNVYRTQFGVDATFRLVRRKPPTLAELGLPETVAKFTEAHQGLVLVTGPAGSGKSTTLAALVDLVNADRAEHILSLEDPIEIVHPEKRALVNQRQVGRDTQSFARALRGALREDPDVIVIGELRDRETISLAVTAAETGHLVMGSMHTSSAARTVARILDAFPPAQQAQVRTMVSESLKGIISQRLVMGVDGKRVVATEVLVVTPAVSNLIREGKLYQIRSMMQTGRQLGMRTMDDALKELVAAGRITQEEARRHLESQSSLSAGDAPAGQQPSGAPAPQSSPTQQAPSKPTPPAPPPERKQGGFASFLRRSKD